MKRICAAILLPMLVLTGCVSRFSPDRQEGPEPDGPVTLTFSVTDPETPEAADPEAEEVILCAKTPAPFTLEADTQGGYTVLKENRPVGGISLLRDDDGAYFERCRTVGDSAFVSEIVDLSEKTGRDCVRNMIFYPGDKNTGEPSSVLTALYIVRVGPYSLNIQALEIPIEDAEAFQESFLPFFRSVSIRE